MSIRLYWQNNGRPASADSEGRQSKNVSFDEDVTVIEDKQSEEKDKAEDEDEVWNFIRIYSLSKIVTFFILIGQNVFFLRHKPFSNKQCICSQFVYAIITTGWLDPSNEHL